MTSQSVRGDDAHRTAAAAAPVVTVDDVASLRKALAEARPGQRIEVAPGQYRPDKPLRITRSGTEDEPITIISARRGKAVFDGESSFDFDDEARVEHVVISGFQFRQSTMLRIRSAARHIRITRNLFEFDEPSGKNTWLMVEADDTRVDRNTFRNKASEGVFLQINGPGDSVAKRVRVDRNLFHDHTFDGANGGEAIRLGYGDKGPAVAGAVISQNLFLRCHGDDEVVSVKCSGNTVRDNTVAEGKRGSIVLRAGNDTEVSGNFLSGTAGIRVCGDDHRVFNNHVRGTTGLVLDSGDATHQPARRALVVHNTVVIDSDRPALNVRADATPPSEVTVAANILVSRGKAVRTPGRPKNFTWRGNVVAKDRGELPEGGGVVADPRLKADAAGVFRLTADSLKVDAIKSAPGPYPDVVTDINGRKRPAVGHAGAEQFETAPEQTRTPLTPEDVGPSAG
ncbi:right-handed parallel beta-helix repeat-containing protein [Streptomyces pactum]|uniref:Right-handed parallel beta-helix repeat-containing protein n=1 Tax=Streptomyces pactum TaxID=68249 RepID=A0ABS0NHH0_9ACTN|nr:polysaccharide lyase 6 family protein [Streptomyces pactum]MBH5334646.1 right-handed parallel beta-helix repeat-containing protein [Streptomyces pactum]